MPAEHGASKDPLVLRNLNYGDTVITPNTTATADCRFVGWDAEIPDAVEGNATFTALYDVFRPKKGARSSFDRRMRKITSDASQPFG